MTQSKIIGITGSIAVGKSTVSNYLREKGYNVVDADELAQEMMTSKEFLKKIGEEFGEEFVEGGIYNREKMGQKVFGNLEELEKLNRITEPFIFTRLKEVADSSNGIVFFDIPLLVESLGKFKKYGIEIDEIWVVYIDSEVQIKRLMERDSIDREYAIKKINSQMSLRDKLEYADVVLENTTLEELYRQIDRQTQKL